MHCLIPDCKVEGNHLKSQSVFFDPGFNKIKRDNYEINSKTPGSVHLIAQMLTPCLIFQELSSIELLIKGGTFVGMSPTSHSF